MPSVDHRLGDIFSRHFTLSIGRRNSSGPINSRVDLVKVASVNAMVLSETCISKVCLLRCLRFRHCRSLDTQTQPLCWSQGPYPSSRHTNFQRQQLQAQTRDPLRTPLGALMGQAEVLSAGFSGGYSLHLTPGGRTPPSRVTLEAFHHAVICFCSEFRMGTSFTAVLLSWGIRYRRSSDQLDSYQRSGRPFRNPTNFGFVKFTRSKPTDCSNMLLMPRKFRAV